MAPRSNFAAFLRKVKEKLADSKTGHLDTKCLKTAHPRTGADTVDNPSLQYFELIKKNGCTYSLRDLPWDVQECILELLLPTDHYVVMMSKEMRVFMQDNIEEPLHYREPHSEARIGRDYVSRFRPYLGLNTKPSIQGYPPTLRERPSALLGTCREYRARFYEGSQFVFLSINEFSDFAKEFPDRLPYIRYLYIYAAYVKLGPHLNNNRLYVQGPPVDEIGLIRQLRGVRELHFLGGVCGVVKRWLTVAVDLHPELRSVCWDEYEKYLSFANGRSINFGSIQLEVAGPADIASFLNLPTLKTSVETLLTALIEYQYNSTLLLPYMYGSSGVEFRSCIVQLILLRASLDNKWSGFRPEDGRDWDTVYRVIAALPDGTRHTPERYRRKVTYEDRWWEKYLDAGILSAAEERIPGSVCYETIYSVKDGYSRTPR